jgi:hypothetical protein
MNIDTIVRVISLCALLMLMVITVQAEDAAVHIFDAA